MIPPLHPNCRCSLVALDTVGAWQYNSPNVAGMLRGLQLALDRLGGGGIFILDPRFANFGISPNTLTRLDLHLEMPISGLDPKLQEGYRELFLLMEELGSNAQAALGQFGEDTSAAFSKILQSYIVLLNAFLQRGRNLFIDAADMSEENPLLAVLMFADATAFGLVSAVLSEVRHRASAFFDEPGLVTGVNLLTLGLADAIYGVFNPEELWSPEHMADLLGATGILSLFGLSRSLLGRGFSSGDEFARSALDELAQGMSDDVLRARLRPPELLDELVRSGEKHSLNDVVAITKTPEGKLVWLETGSESAGLKHILIEHEGDFVANGITTTQIPEFLMEAIQNGKIISYQSRDTSRPVFEVIYNGQTRHVAITISDNGFIVGANPKSKP